MTELTLASAFLDGAGPEWAPRRVLGCRLRKFSLWHRLQLNTLGSPFMHEGMATIRDLRVAVGVCRTRFGDSRIHKPKAFALWFYPRLILSILTPRMPWSPKAPPDAPNAAQRALVKHIDAFLEYCGDYLQDPEFAVIPREGITRKPRTKRGRFDEEFEHACELIRYGFSEQQAWDMPIGRANLYRVDALRAAGADVDVTTQKERDFMANLPPEYRVNES